MDVAIPIQPGVWSCKLKKKTKKKERFMIICHKMTLYFESLSKCKVWKCDFHLEMKLYLSKTQIHKNNMQCNLFIDYYNRYYKAIRSHFHHNI